MRKAFTILLVGTILLSLMLPSCKHENGIAPTTPSGNATGDSTGNAVSDTGICFTRDILPIFISNCAKSGCHNAISHEEGYVFTSYETITAKKIYPGNPEKTELYEAITEEDEDDIMPQPPAARLSAEQIALIRNWILQGAPNSDCSSDCDETVFTYSGAILPSINKYCKGCHNSSLASGGHDLSTYPGVKAAVASGRLMGAISRSAGYTAMPQSGAKLSDCEINQFQKWIDAGAPDN